MLAAQLRHEATLPAPPPPLDVVASAEHPALARQVASLATVPLHNEPLDGTPVLPPRAADQRWAHDRDAPNPPVTP
jgi:beta-glucosidase